MKHQPQPCKIDVECKTNILLNLLTNRDALVSWWGAQGVVNGCLGARQPGYTQNTLSGPSDTSNIPRAKVENRSVEQ